MTATANSAARPGTVHVVVTCANRKTVPVPAGLRLDSVPRRSGAGRAREWIRRLTGLAGVPFTAARDLYAGEHWMIARGLPGAAGHGAGPAVGVLGGLRPDPCGRPVRPYAATFSGPEDRVPGGADGARQWWQALAGWEGPAPGQPRSITSLAAADPSASFLLALSAAYLGACRDDITDAATQVADPDALHGDLRRSPVSREYRRGHGAGDRPGCNPAWAAPGRRSTSGSPPTCCPPGSAAAPTHPGT